MPAAIRRSGNSKLVYGKAKREIVAARGGGHRVLTAAIVQVLKTEPGPGALPVDRRYVRDWHDSVAQASGLLVVAFCKEKVDPGAARAMVGLLRAVADDAEALLLGA